MLALGRLALLWAAVVASAAPRALHLGSKTGGASLEQQLDSELAKLRAAALGTGAAGLERLKSVVPALLVYLEATDTAGAWSPSANGTAEPAAAKVSLKAKRLEPAAQGYTAALTAHLHTSSCLFDDGIFSLSSTAKVELLNEITQDPLANSLQYVRRGGWFSCATADWQVPINCPCNGYVRLVDLGRTQLSPTTVDGSIFPNNEVPCTSAAFGQVPQNGHPDFAWRGCECAEHMRPDVSSPDGFHLGKRLSSKSVLQEAWVMLTRMLGRGALLPLGTGDRTYGGIDNWSKRMPTHLQNSFPNYIFERYWVDKFLREMQPYIPGPKCLEWGHPDKPGQMLHYVHRMPQCTEPYDMQFDFIHYRGAPMHVNGNVVHSDILSLPNVLPPELRMNAIFATQVFEHVADPIRAAQALFAALAPGGALIFTAPQSAPFHKVPHDYFRYTAEGAKYVLVQAGFCAPNHLFTGGGDFMFSIAADAGLLVQDFSLEEVDGAYQTGLEAISHDAIGIHALAFKPPHAVCDDPTSGWAYMNQQGMRA